MPARNGRILASTPEHSHFAYATDEELAHASPSRPMRLRSGTVEFREYPAGALKPGMLMLQADGMTDRVKSGLAKLGVCRPEDIEDIKYLFVPDSYPVYPLDYREKLKRIWEQLDRYENLRSVGRSGQFWYNNMARSMRAGIETAQEHLGTFKG